MGNSHKEAQKTQKKFCVLCASLSLVLPVRQCLRNGQGRPTGSRRGDPLVAAEGKSTFEVTLNWKGMGLDEPSPVGILRREQEDHAFSIRRIGRWHTGGVQCI